MTAWFAYVVGDRLTPHNTCAKPARNTDLKTVQFTQNLLDRLASCAAFNATTTCSAFWQYNTRKCMGHMHEAFVLWNPFTIDRFMNYGQSWQEQDDMQCIGLLTASATQGKLLSVAASHRKCPNYLLHCQGHPYTNSLQNKDDGLCYMQAQINKSFCHL